MEKQFVSLPLLNLQLLSLLGKIEGEHLDGESGISDQKNYARGDYEDQDEDSISKTLLLIGRPNLITNYNANPLSKTLQNRSR